MTLQTQAIALLSASILRPVALAAGAWMILRLFRIRHPASRHAVWTAVLIGMIVLPLMSVMSPHWNVPVLPRKQAPPVQPQAVPLTYPPPEFLDPPPVSKTVTVVERPTTETLVVWCYLAGFLAMFAYRVAGWVLLRRVLARSTRLGVPWLRESSDVVSPVAVGVLRPAVLLPIGWRDWSSDTRSAVLAHEFAHLRRKDTLVASLGRFLKSVLWFHPLAWWISRQLSELAELACDAVALETVGDPAGYSRVLLQFVRGVKKAGYSVALPGLAMADSSGLVHRIDQVFELSRGRMRRLSRPRAVLAFLGVPAVCVAATVGLGARAPLTLPAIRLPQVVPQVEVAQVRTQAAAPPPVVTTPPRGMTGTRFETAFLEIAGAPVSGELCWGGCGGPLSPYPESRNQITYKHFTVRKILTRAYHLKEFQISGPGSIDSVVYDVSATATPGTPEEQFQVMLQNLLADRLHLSAHQEIRDFISGYELRVADGGPKLKASEDPSAGPPALPPSRPGYLWVPVAGGGKQIGYIGIPEGSLGENTYSLPSEVDSVRNLAGVLTVLLDSPVLDRTGLTQRYDIDLRDFVPSSLLKTRPSHVERHADEPDCFSALQSGLEQLGLTLVEKTTPTVVLVVDHVE